MNILLVGSGGREHSFAVKLKESPLCAELFIAPGNAGTATEGTNLDIAVADFPALSEAAIKYNIDLILVGPEEPLVKGITDFFKADEKTKHIIVIGPGKEASQLEGSKSYAKAFMLRHNIPTAASREFTRETFAEGIQYINEHPLPIVLKADGLAAGKGVLICESYLETQAEFELMIMQDKFGEAGRKVVVEEFLQGIEMSIFLLTDGKDYVMLPEAKDYKRIGNGDSGLNTGGMGAISPVPLMTADLLKKIIDKIAKPSIDGLQKEGLNYRGFLFVGLMIVNNEPYVIEYNCRMGDPETEVVMPRLKNDLVKLLLATANGDLNNTVIEVDERTTVGIVAVSGGYPGEYEKGKKIEGLNASLPGSILFHSGTAKQNDDVVTAGGRVLVAVSFGENIREASEQSDYLLQQLFFEGINYRTDIGYEFLHRK